MIQKGKKELIKKSGEKEARARLGLAPTPPRKENKKAEGMEGSISI